MPAICVDLHFLLRAVFFVRRSPRNFLMQDKLVNPLGAILLSVTMVLIFGAPTAAACERGPGVTHSGVVRPPDGVAVVLLFFA